jgi:mono/diheme cytochrome c family protein
MKQMQFQTGYCVYILLILFASSQANANNSPAIQDKDALDINNHVFLNQNWSDEDRLWFYHTDQGSRLIPYKIFIHLEQPGRNELIINPENMLRYGYLPSEASKLNPDSLSVGLSRNGDHLGLTCAACHTQQVKYQGKFIRIDGGQSMLDLPMFLGELEQAMEETLTDPDKFNRFVSRVSNGQYSEKKGNRIRQSLKSSYEKRKNENHRNHSDVAYGYSRLDAFGAILNKGLHLTGVKDNFNPPNAPTSYPYLWDTPQHDYVEWNGSQSNSSVGALARNVGEVIGVFGDVVPKTKKWLFFFDGGYTSSVQARNLRKLEIIVSQLHSPTWPESFPSINKKKAGSGRQLYSQYCLGCHADIDRTDPGRKIQVKMSTLSAIGTDPVMAKNALAHQGKTGIFKGRPRFYSVGGIMGEEAPALFVVNNIMIGVLKNNPIQSLLAKRDSEKMGHPDVIHPPKYVDGKIIPPGQEVSDRALLAYKARPLNGIWTGGPYLHNGSVPNLYQLLLPAEKRDKTFYIGSWEFDPVNVGYISTETPGSFLFDTRLEGNSNAGHEYGTGYDGLPVLTEEEIWNLVEYMKTL